MTSPLDEEENEVLQEVINIGMGQAGASLAELLDVFVQLSVPRVYWVDGEQFVERATALVDDQGGTWTGVGQVFYNQLEGECFAIYGADSCQYLGELMRYDVEGGSAEAELLLDVTNILMGACLLGVAQQLKKDVDFSAPVLIGTNESIPQLLEARDRRWRQCLLMEVNFRLENSDFTCHLLILLSDSSIDQLQQGLEEFMANY